MEFLFWLFLVGLLVAVFQDFSRREVDNWLNVFLFVSGVVFILFLSIFSNDAGLVLYLLFCIVIIYALANAFYYSRVFAGGDAKLLIGLSAMFVGAGFLSSLLNIGVFVLSLLILGSVWGLIYGLFLFFKNFKSCSSGFKKEFENKYLRYLVMFGIVLFVLSYVWLWVLFLSLFVFLSVVLYAFAQVLDKKVFIKSLSVSGLREGDFLVDDVHVGKKVIKADWQGLERKDLDFLKKFGASKKIRVKDGVPYVPGFLIAFLVYWFFKESLVSALLGVLA